MAKRYSKLYSNFILRKKYQYSTHGSIWERDWVTIGANHQIERGKRVLFGDSGFLFTDNNIISSKKKHKLSEVVAKDLTYDKVKDAVSQVNVVSVNKHSNDLRDFAYYGSCSELIRAAIENIVAWFPGQITTSEDDLELYFDDGRIYQGDNQGYRPGEDLELISEGNDEASVRKKYKIVGKELINPFGINLHYDGVKLGPYANTLRYMSKTYQQYVLETSTDDKYEISKFEIKDDLDEYLSGSDVSDKASEKLRIQRCNDFVHLYTINITTEEDQLFVISCNSIYGKVRYFWHNKTETKDVTIKPQDEIINEYFDGLEGIEKQLLTRQTQPYYKNSFITPVETNDIGEYRYVLQKYQWPSQGYCIMVDGIDFTQFVEQITDLSTKLDQLWCDNLWRNMTHEAIKNYDWTYTRDITSDELPDYILGGQRVEKLLHIYGRVFDDLKRYIDGIKLSANISYDMFNNMSEAEISDKLEYEGWEVFSTIPFFDENKVEITTLTEKFLNGYYDDGETLPNITKEEPEGLYYNKWYSSVNCETITPQSVDVEFVRQLLLSTKYIMQSKGTIASIDMIMALFGISPEEYKITERYSVVEPQLINADPSSIWLPEKIGNLVHRGEVGGDDPLIYDDPYKGIPMGEVELYDYLEGGLPPSEQTHNNGVYIVPFYDSKKQYDGNFAFQSKGGWGRQDDSNEYIETLSYLRILLTTTDLLNMNPNELKTGDIIYVVSLKDAQDNQIVVTPPTGLPIGSPNYIHYFYCKEPSNPNNTSSWFVFNDDNYKYHKSEYEEYIKKVKYIENIISTSVGNNPHVGFGNYDCGDEYLAYLRRPFKYTIDNTITDLKREMEEYDFGEIITVDGQKQKIKNVCRTYTINDSNAKDPNWDINDATKQPYLDKEDTEVGSTTSETNGLVSNLTTDIAELDGLLNAEDGTGAPILSEDEMERMSERKSDLESIRTQIESGKPMYYLNDKNIAITNAKNDINKMYEKYFTNILFPFLSQMIPSTAILTLKGFRLKNES